MQQLTGQTSDVKMLQKLNQDWLNAIVKKDSSTLGKILGDDFIMVNPGGKKLTRKDNLALISAQGIIFSSIVIDSVSVRIFGGDTGIVSCWTTFAYKADGKEMTGKNCYQDIYIRRKNKWQAVSAHVALLSMK
jgi:ketosteroid isomerase-like protein